MAASGYDDSGSSDTFLIIVLLACAGFYFFLSHNFYIIAGVWKYLRIVELSIFYWIPDWLPIYGKLEIKQAVHFLLATPATDIPSATVAEFDKHYARWFTWIPGLIMVHLGVKHLLKSNNISDVYDMEALLSRVESYYPFLSDFVENRPEKMDLDYKREKPETSRWGVSMAPAEFAIMVPPLGLEKDAKKNKSLNQAIWDGKEGYDMDLAERAFKAQLGTVFGGLKTLSKAERRLYDFLMPKLNVDLTSMTDMTRVFLKDILKVPGAKKVNLKRLGDAEKTLYMKLKEHVQRQLKNKKVDKKGLLELRAIEKLVLSKSLEKIYKNIAAQQIMGMHAFNRVGLMSLLVEARNGGVVACNEFIWLKGMDRILWYCMSSVGRKVSFVESSGCFAHWLIEQQIGRPLPHPEVQEAVEGLFKALKLDVKVE